jgi:hypothetical protein
MGTSKKLDFYRRYTMSIAKLSASVLLSALACSACSTQKKDQAPAATSPAPKISDDQAKADGAKLPSMAIIKVPVDENGKEILDKAEMRLVANDQQLTQENISSAFEAAQVPQNVINELDQTSSTESFCGWMGWGLGFRGYYGGGYGWNWGFYRPTYLNYGYNYGYNYGGYYGGIPGGGYGNGGGPGAGAGNGYNNGGAGNQGYGNGYGGNNNYYYYNNSFNRQGQGGYSGQGYNPSNTYTNGVY